jgi:hypothetical protein
MRDPIHAIIGVRTSGPATFYVKRSLEMANYPGVWSLLSIQFRPEQLCDPRTDLPVVAELFQRMSVERLGGVPIKVQKYLTSGSSNDNPMNVDVRLHLYEVSFEDERLNPKYYTEGAWLRPEEYDERCADQICGLCLRLWADYAWMNGITDRPFQSLRSRF